MTSILGITFSDKTLKKTSELLSDTIDNNRENALFHVVTANPEIVMMAKNNEKLKSFISSSNLVTPDGIGIVIGSKILKTPLSERVTGYDLLHQTLLFREEEKRPTRIFCVGGSKDVIEKATKRLSSLYPLAEIVGYRDGYFTFSSSDEVVLLDELKEKKPDLLLVGLGSPKQEEFIFKAKGVLSKGVAIGVGGSFDVLSGNVKRAPKLFQKLHLEWFWRLMMDPKRWRRQLLLPAFIIEVGKERWKRND